MSKTFAALINNWGTIQSYFFDNAAEALHKFQFSKRLGRLSCQLREGNDPIEYHLKSKPNSKSFEDGKVKSINEVSALLALYLAYVISRIASRDLMRLAITDIIEEVVQQKS